MPKTLRVHNLAKEIGVPSREIIKKCRAEGVELKNHMAAISVGLAESIREWFSVGDDVTTVEVSPQVDLQSIRVEPEVVEKTAEAAPSRQEQPEPATETPPHTPQEVQADVAAADEATEEETVEERGVAATAEEQPAPTTLEPAVEHAEETLGTVAPEPDDEAEAAAPEPGSDEEPATGEEQDHVRPAAEAPMTSESEPTESPKTHEVRPAGPQVVPQPAELKGPRVVRIESPERVSTPRPRPRPAASAPVTMPDMPAQEGARGRGRERSGAEGDRKVVRRSRSPRRQRNTEVVEGLEREWRDQDVIERRERLASATGQGLRARRSAARRRQTSATPTQPARKTEVELTTPTSIKDFCSAIGQPFAVVSKKLIAQTNKLYRINDSLDTETAELIAMELGVTLKITEQKTALERIKTEFAARERNNLQPRPPVVAMLGHVDHGKTSLLDAIRKSHVAAGEAGGITQHIGASRIDRGNWHVTFLDTPGHEAFTAMRARGANLTDVVVLVVAADDGVMPQTAEAIAHAKAAGVQIVVAMNKIDLPNVDLNRVYAQLAERELTPREWGGETDVIKTSATSGEGIDDLLEHLSTLTEILELRADPSIPARGTVIEAQMKEGRGVTAQLLVQEGTLKPGQFVVCGPGAGRVRALLDDRGKRLKEASPGTPVEVTGLDELPEAGDPLYVVKSLAEAKDIAAEVRDKRRQAALSERSKKQTLEDLLRQGDEGDVPELNVILKADVQGSIDALRTEFDNKIASEKAKLRVLHSAVGAVSEADVDLAQASNALIVGFNVVAEDRARKAADRAGVEVRLYRVIYEVLDDIRKAMEGLLEPERSEEYRARVEVRQVFNVSRVGTIAGCYVTDGVVGRNHRVRLTRDGVIITEGKRLASLKRFKDDAREVRAGLECGIKIENYDDVKPGDVIETFEVVDLPPTL